MAREIDEVGGKVRRVVLDYELKQELYNKLSRVDPNKKLAYERIRVAHEYDLKVVNDKIPVPEGATVQCDRHGRRIHHTTSRDACSVRAASSIEQRRATAAANAHTEGFRAKGLGTRLYFRP